VTGLHQDAATGGEAFLSGAYRRIQRIAIALGLLASITGAVWLGWRAGLILLAGSVVGFLNFLWLHRKSELLTEKMLATGKAPSGLRLGLAFAARYVFMAAAVYVIFKSYPVMFVAFCMTLALPVVAAMCEGFYEAVAHRRSDEVSH
jgi:hypothetical protein